MFTARFHYVPQDRLNGTFCILEISEPFRPSSFWPPVREGFFEHLGGDISHISARPWRSASGHIAADIGSLPTIGALACRVSSSRISGAMSGEKAIDIYDHIDKEELRRSYLSHVTQLGFSFAQFFSRLHLFLGAYLILE